MSMSAPQGSARRTHQGANYEMEKWKNGYSLQYLDVFAACLLFFLVIVCLFAACVFFMVLLVLFVFAIVCYVLLFFPMCASLRFGRGPSVAGAYFVLLFLFFCFYFRFSLSLYLCHSIFVVCLQTFLIQDLSLIHI